ncbi:alpha/beta hydrolase [Streptomyces sp. NPDC018031]|uniref:alpha/beta hydrolase n=1 Tax=Streptomyces sp. NPDC018031 TaxID=3365033 RepID=UPI00379F6B9B
MTRGSEAESARRGVPPVTSGARRVTLLTDDGVPIDAAYTPGAGPADGPAIVVAHGFTGALERPVLRRAAAGLGPDAAVVTFSFRGHGRSGGRSTVGDREVRDLAAAVRWAREMGHRRVVTVGFSMGGSVVLRQAALCNGARRTPEGTVEIQPDGPRPSAEHREHGTGRAEHSARRTGRESRGTRNLQTAPGCGPALPAGLRDDAHPDAVVAVSAPARWYYRGTAPMRRLHWVVTRPTGRLVSRYGLRTRIARDDWDPVPLSPVASVPMIAPAPLLIVHGDQDPYFPLDHPRMLAEAGDPSSTELWIERGMGHAENAATPELLGRIAAWATAHT